MKRLNLIKSIDRIPPFLCRLMATKNHGYKALTHEEVAVRSGIPRSTVADVSVKTTWSGVQLGTISKFAEACGVDLMMSDAQLKRKLSRVKMAHYLRSKGRQREFLVRLMKSNA